MSIVVVELTIPSEDIEFGRVLCAETDVRITVETFVPLGQYLAPYFWVETDDPDSFEARLRDDEHVSTLERLANEDANHLYRIEWAQEPGGLTTALRTHDLIIERAIGTREHWRFALRGPNHENLSAFKETLQDQGISISVRSLRNVDAPNRNSLGLTDKQRQAVELALRRGYFSVPRESNLSELAEQTGISRQSFSRRLNRGLANVLTETALEDEPGT